MLFKVWQREFYLVMKDPGVLLFFFALPTLYPIVYTLIYNPEIVEKIPVAVVDNSRSAKSRELVRMLDATQSVDVAGYAANMSEARKWMNEHHVYGIFEVSDNYATKVGRGEQATVTFYSDMSLLLRYRAFLSALTDIQLSLGSEIRMQKVEASGMLGSMATGGGDSTPLNVDAIMMGDPTSGFASFVIPGILILILQQSMVLGVAMLAGGSAERRRRNGGIDPLAIPATPGATLLGKMLCYVVLYIPLVLYILHIVPSIFSLPHVGNIWHELLFVAPMLIASVFLGELISVFVSERESSMAVVVFTSVIFLFLSGLTWPRYAMNWFWHTLGDFVPATWGVEGFIRINSNGSTLAEQSEPYIWLWGLALFYFVLAYLFLLWKKKNACFCSTPTR